MNSNELQSLANDTAEKIIHLFGVGHINDISHTIQSALTTQSAAQQSRSDALLHEVAVECEKQIATLRKQSAKDKEDLHVVNQLYKESMEFIAARGKYIDELEQANRDTNALIGAQADENDKIVAKLIADRDKLTQEKESWEKKHFAVALQLNEARHENIALAVAVKQKDEALLYIQGSIDVREHEQEIARKALTNPTIRSTGAGVEASFRVIEESTILLSTASLHKSI